MPRLQRNDRDYLYRSGAGADDPDPFATKVDPILGPHRRIVGFTSELLGIRNNRGERRGQYARCTDEVEAAVGAAVLRGQAPSIGRLVVDGGLDPGPELDIALQVQTVGDVLKVTLHF